MPNEIKNTIKKIEEQGDKVISDGKKIIKRIDNVMGKIAEVIVDEFQKEKKK